MRGISFVSVYFFYSSMPCYTLLRYFREAVLVGSQSTCVVLPIGTTHFSRGGRGQRHRRALLHRLLGGLQGGDPT